jgi:hypothetical protein
VSAKHVLPKLAFMSAFLIAAPVWAAGVGGGGGGGGGGGHGGSLGAHGAAGSTHAASVSGHMAAAHTAAGHVLAATTESQKPTMPHPPLPHPIFNPTHRDRGSQYGYGTFSPVCISYTAPWSDCDRPMKTSTHK